MKKLILINILISFLIFMSCNNSNEVEETKVNKVISNPDEKKSISDNTNDLTLLETGKSFAVQTKEVLAKNLLNAINTKGTEHALSFCNEKAYPLTDSMASVLNAQIKRVSDKTRNPKNLANKEESAYIKKSKELLAKGESIKPEMAEINGKLVGYYPILTNKMCLQCHGDPNTEVLTNTLLQIEKLYPNDKAVGYKINELRGIWVVEMNKK